MVDTENAPPVLPGEPAPLGPRLLAGAVDLLAVLALGAALSLVPMRMGALALPMIGAIVAILAWLVLPMAAFKSTPGLRLFGLELTGMDGRPGDFTELMARELLGRGLIGFAYFSTVLIGLAGQLSGSMALFQPTGLGLLLFLTSGAIMVLSFCGQIIILSRPDRRGLPDLMAKTVVVRRGSGPQPAEAMDAEELALAGKAARARALKVLAAELLLVGGAALLPFWMSRPSTGSSDFAARVAVARAEQAYNANKAQPAAAEELAELLREQGEGERAEQILREHQAALSSLQRGREQALRARFDQDPANADALSELLELYEGQQRLADAQQAFEAHAKAAGDADTRASLGVWLYEHEKAADAVRELDLAIAAGAQSAEVHAYRGWSLKALGKAAEARAAFKKALALDPELEEVQAELE